MIFLYFVYIKYRRTFVFVVVCIFVIVFLMNIVCDGLFVSLFVVSVLIIIFGVGFCWLYGLFCVLCA